MNMGTFVGPNVLSRKEGGIEVIAHPEVWGPKYIRHPGEDEYCFRGIPFRKVDLEERLGARFIESREPMWITEDIVWSGEVPMVNDFEKVAKICFLKASGGKDVDGGATFVPDPLNDDAAVYLKTELGLVVVLGCAHRGIINTLVHAREVTGMDKVHMVVGGTHLHRASDYQMESTVRELRRMGVEKVGVSHCTGLASAARLASELGEDAFFYNNAGNIIHFV
jgi:7,8-dihydropterin-6-yl-methyl-4-(beta-D-ribofuranosyl)aminobenzene 5'-phosphate synthase